MTFFVDNVGFNLLYLLPSTENHKFWVGPAIINHHWHFRLNYYADVVEYCIYARLFLLHLYGRPLPPDWRSARSPLGRVVRPRAPCMAAMLWNVTLPLLTEAGRLLQGLIHRGGKQMEQESKGQTTRLLNTVQYCCIHFECEGNMFILLVMLLEYL